MRGKTFERSTGKNRAKNNRAQNKRAGAVNNDRQDKENAKICNI